ncbi:hypothetical protein [Leptolyngbya sp. PCC 6406]|uniref:hypothetical protein n=1 Tax=Leptolyngbya sp. PCC 6406 TaxID=1173264 RepID=UPI00138AFB2B|nr:hypothetical protein [Leptolyngbya sp. PCC 6406]
MPIRALTTHCPASPGFSTSRNTDQPTLGFSWNLGDSCILQTLKTQVRQDLQPDDRPDISDDNGHQCTPNRLIKIADLPSSEAKAKAAIGVVLGRNPQKSVKGGGNIPFSLQNGFTPCFGRS